MLFHLAGVVICLSITWYFLKCHLILVHLCSQSRGELSLDLLSRFPLHVGDDGFAMAVDSLQKNLGEWARSQTDSAGAVSASFLN